MWRLQLGAGQRGLFAGFGLKIRRGGSFRRLNGRIVFRSHFSTDSLCVNGATRCQLVRPVPTMYSAIR